MKLTVRVPVGALRPGVVIDRTVFIDIASVVKMLHLTAGTCKTDSMAA